MAFKKSSKESKEIEDSRFSEDPDVASIQREALIESQKAVMDAAREAQEIIKMSVKISSEARQDIEARLLAAAQAVEDETRRSIDQIFVHHSRTVKRLSDELSEAAKVQLIRMREALDASLAAALEDVSDEMSDQAKAAKLSVTKYEQDEKDRIKKELMEKIPKIIQQVVGRSISADDHERLIDEALQSITAEADITTETDLK